MVARVLIQGNASARSRSDGSTDAGLVILTRLPLVHVEVHVDAVHLNLLSRLDIESVRQRLHVGLAAALEGNLVAGVAALAHNVVDNAPAPTGLSLPGAADLDCDTSVSLLKCTVGRWVILTDVVEEVVTAAIFPDVVAVHSSPRVEDSCDIAVFLAERNRGIGQ